ncbi:uncharacterized protein LOC123560560 [Mercenaria mercenaria]|uniref:uncharacterized protein LOC123560560 n=1 Tax=Mercenaria mercenaria TaxID=6596 RepID=UPI001E1D25E9|nr:uncharacterized protein LOC123560560 [Mercenaria mercenaria]
MEYMTVISFFFILVAQAESTPCPVPDDIPNGEKVYTGTSVTYTCRKGYVISSGNATRTCSGGTWSGTLPTCTDMDDIFSFECDMAGTVTAVNPDPSSLIWAQASNEDGPCDTEFAAGNASVIISGCSADKVISLVLSPYSTVIPTLIMNDVKFYNVTCKSIPHDGILVVVTDSTWIKNKVRTSHEPYAQPGVIINSGIEGVRAYAVNETVQNQTVLINELIHWKLFVPEPYLIQPLNCTAYSGEIDAAGSKKSLDIIELGCTLDPSLVSDFRIGNTQSEVISDLYAFRFAGSEKVDIVCSVKVCPNGSSACDFTCDDRKRRSVPYISSANDYNEAVTAAEESVKGRYARDADVTGTRTARLSLRVIGPPNVGLENMNFFSGSTPRVTYRTATLILAALSRLIRV